MSKNIDAEQFKRAFISGAMKLSSEKEYINELNVFPVPDGDTGTNMTMTIMSSYKAVSEVSDITIENIAKAMASGSLRGARGNSGVILSQLIRGFTKEVRENGYMDSLVLARAFQRAVETAYKAVMKPKEGTILTVAKAMADKISELCLNEEDVISLLKKTEEYGDEILLKTPEMLPVLKEAGVVDSGGQGLMMMIHGIVDSLEGKETPEILPAESPEIKESKSSPAVSRGEISTADIKFGYCTEFMVNGSHEFSDEEVDSLREYLEKMGDSIVCFSDENIIKVHVHTNHPGQAFEKGLEMGYLSRMKVDNMRLEHNEILIEDASRLAAEEMKREETEEKEDAEVFKGKYGFITVSAGDGLTEIFKGLGVTRVIEGGQTMNPSTEDIVNACESLDTDVTYILPNNKNIILAANQARDLLDDRKIVVIPSKTIPQGISSMIGFNPEADEETNTSLMQEAMGLVSSCEVTYAVRDTRIDGREIKVGDIMAIGDAGLLSVGSDMEETIKESISNMLSDESEIITLYYGQDIEERKAVELSEKLQAFFPEMEIELQYGGQPVYYYFISVE